MSQPQAQSDRDLASIAEARTLARRAKAAASPLAELPQERIDAIVDAMAAAATAQAEPLARLAHEETGYGVVADKIQKNLFASRDVHAFIRPMKTVGVINKIEDRKVVEIAVADPGEHLAEGLPDQLLGSGRRAAVDRASTELDAQIPGPVAGER
jgi:acyl-CoA reductase-like NAD-dependent aldehyde dehydrogenase